jgi:hypothetical protein
MMTVNIVRMKTNPLMVMVLVEKEEAHVQQ